MAPMNQRRPGEEMRQQPAVEVDQWVDQPGASSMSTIPTARRDAAASEDSAQVPAEQGDHQEWTSTRLLGT
jgi:hypothetical protein